MHKCPKCKEEDALEYLNDNRETYKCAECHEQFEVDPDYDWVNESYQDCSTPGKSLGNFYSYRVTIVGKRDLYTLTWLDDRGYAGNLCAIADYLKSEYEDGICPDEIEISRTYGLTEAMAHEYKEYIENDGYAFLTCCGSETLSKALQDLLHEIV